ncbi:MAG: ABC transporter permease [Chloroflexota bacterium]|nr:ABC transporter permease [Chloroflexota bacterium]
MAKYILKRLAQILLTLFVFLSIVFFIVNAQPGDVSNTYALNPDLPPETREELRELFGVNEPLWKQYLRHVSNTLTGNFGVSFSHYPRSVSDVIAERLPRTLVLFITASVISFYLGFGLGKIIAWRRGTWTEYASTISGVTLYTVFTPWFGLMMIWLFAFKAGWFPIGKFLDPVLWRDSPIDANTVFNRMIVTAIVLSIVVFLAFLFTTRRRVRNARLIQVGAIAVATAAIAGVWMASGVSHLAFDIVKHMALPVITLTLISFAGTMLLTRNSMLETMREDYVLAARAKGLPENQVRDKHVARNALLPVVTSFVFSLAFAIDGGVIIESIFSWPGMGQTLVAAAVSEDLPLAVGAFVFVGIFVLVAHLAADILYVYLDPRIRY